MRSPLSSLVHHLLETHHAFLRAELPRLEVALGAEDRALRADFASLRERMEEHLWWEETLLFPAVLAMAELGEVHPDLTALLADVPKKVNEIRAAEAAMRAHAPNAGVLEPELLAVLDDLCEHARIEAEELLPLAQGTAEATPHAIEVDAAPVTRVIRHTRGVCPTCHATVPADVQVRDGCVELAKTCPEHGVSTQLLSRRPEYWGDLDQFYFSVNKDAYPQRDYIVRMTERCNLACPICLAKANTEDTPDLDLTGLGRLLSERRGIKIDLMAAEPTLRPDLFDWVRKVKASGNIAALHTNGLKLADAAYVAQLKEAGVDEVFLQFDGLDDDANKALRGRPLLKARLAAMANLRAADIATSLIVVIARGLNEGQVAETFRFALRPENDHVREVFFLGLRSLGSARHSASFGDQLLMPDELIDLLAEQEPSLRRQDIHAFNKLYFAMLSAFRVRKCLYVQHYLVARDDGGYTPISDILDLGALSVAADRYAERLPKHPTVARAGLAAALVKAGLRPSALKMANDFVRLEQLFATGMNLSAVPRRFLLLGFITACDPDNFDAEVAVNCGKGELSVDGGFTDSSAVANVMREARFEASGRDPGKPRLDKPPRRDEGTV